MREPDCLSARSTNALAICFVSVLVAAALLIVGFRTAFVFTSTVVSFMVLPMTERDEPERFETLSLATARLLKRLTCEQNQEHCDERHRDHHQSDHDESRRNSDFTDSGNHDPRPRDV
jgi:hypothetical protein